VKSIENTNGILGLEDEDIRCEVDAKYFDIFL